jgi:hypothetical protein
MCKVFSPKNWILAQKNNELQLLAVLFPCLKQQMTRGTQFLLKDCLKD